MKLITETLDTVSYLAEDKNGKKSHFIEGIFLQSEQKNRNGRLYRKETLKREVNRYMKEYVQSNRALGELGHPDGPSINLDRVSHIIVDLKEDGNNWIGKAKLLDTPMGTIAKNLIEGGAQLGVSSRGMGSLKMTKEGYNLVQDDFYLATAADIVADPSAPDAFVQGIMENKEWVYVNGVWQSDDIDSAKRIITEAKKAQLEEAKLAVFKTFLQKLK